MLVGILDYLKRIVCYFNIDCVGQQYINRIHHSTIFLIDGTFICIDTNNTDLIRDNNFNDS